MSFSYETENGKRVYWNIEQQGKFWGGSLPKQSSENYPLDIDFLPPGLYILDINTREEDMSGLGCFSGSLLKYDNYQGWNKNIIGTCNTCPTEFEVVAAEPANPPSTAYV